jgi:phosphonoacetate hydrolase
VGTDERRAAVSEIEAVLCDTALDHLVEMVLTHPEADTYRAAASDGDVTFRRRDVDGSYHYDLVTSSGRNPVADQATDRLVGHDLERDRRFPPPAENAYPHAHDSIAQFFDSPHAPDLVATHRADHHFGDHLGQHGSLGIVQARAPFLAAGAGIRSLGAIERSTRTVNVAPTIAAVLDLDPHPEGVGPTGRRRADARLRRQDGDVEADLLDGERADHVVVFLLDGCNANLLADVIESGEAPNLADLVRRGTHYRRGAMASLPTATLANHTTAVTGAHPGHSGVLHNTWYDRGTDSAPDLLSMDQMFTAMQHLDPDVETLFGAVHRSRPGAHTTATFEFCDTDADFSSFGLLRNGPPPPFPHRDEVRHVDPAMRDGSTSYSFMSTIDHVSATHTIAAWDRVEGNPLPTLSWCSLAVTDDAGHESGPHGDAARAAVRDSDARIGDVLAAVDRAGVTERTAVFVIADHGMEQNDPTNTGSWCDAVDSTGIATRIVEESFIYLR